MLRSAILIILVCVLGFLLFQQCSKNETLKEQQDNTINYLNDSVRFYQNKLGQEVATKNTLAGDNEQLEILLAQSNKEFDELTKKYKRVKSAVQIRTITRIDSFFVPFADTINFTFERPFIKDSDHYRIKGIVSNEGIAFNDISIPMTLSYLIGERKNGLFKPRTISIDAKTDNPFVNIQGLDSYIYKPDVKRWSVGLYVGYDFINGDMGIGFGLQYSLFRF